MSLFGKNEDEKMREWIEEFETALEERFYLYKKDVKGFMKAMKPETFILISVLPALENTIASIHNDFTHGVPAREAALRVAAHLHKEE